MVLTTDHDTLLKSEFSVRFLEFHCHKAKFDHYPGGRLLFWQMVYQSGVANHLKGTEKSGREKCFCVRCWSNAREL